MIKKDSCIHWNIGNVIGMISLILIGHFHTSPSTLITNGNNYTLFGWLWSFRYFGHYRSVTDAFTQRLKIQLNMIS
ncbi:hypothetical protein ACH3XW_34390 [Acanthocheilonema viteae]